MEEKRCSISGQKKPKKILHIEKLKICTACDLRYIMKENQYTLNERSSRITHKAFFSQSREPFTYSH
jgi:hypothetical protein